MKKKSKCSVNCECTNCTNVSAHQSLNDSELGDVAIEEELTTIDARDVEDIMDWVFQDQVDSESEPDSDCELDSDCKLD